MNWKKWLKKEKELEKKAGDELIDLQESVAEKKSTSWILIGVVSAGVLALVLVLALVPGII